MSIIANRQRHAWSAPDVPRTAIGSVLWPEDTRAAWYQLCDLARVAGDTQLSPAELKARLWEHGEATKLSTVEAIYDAMEEQWRSWRDFRLDAQ